MRWNYKSEKKSGVNFMCDDSDRGSTLIKLKKYYELMKQCPELFYNVEKDNALKIITDKALIEQEYKKLCVKYTNMGKPVSWIDIGVISEDEWYLTIRDLVLFPDGEYHTYIRFVNKKYWIDKTPSVIILPCYQGKIFLIKQFRHDLRNFVWQTPRGYGENGISNEESARRELLEELGVNAGKLIQLNNFDNSSDHVLFYADLLSMNVVQADKHEGICGFELISVEDYEQWILNGKIKDEFTIKLYVFAKLKGLI